MGFASLYPSYGTSHFLVCKTVRWPHSFGNLTVHRRVGPRAPVHIEIKRDPDMRHHRVILGLALAVGAAPAALAEEYRGTWEQQMACTPDVWRLCSDQIPDVNRIVACLQQNTPNLSSGCRAVFQSNNSMPQSQAVPPPTPRGRVAPPPTARAAPPPASRAAPPPAAMQDDED